MPPSPNTNASHCSRLRANLSKIQPRDWLLLKSQLVFKPRTPFGVAVLSRFQTRGGLATLAPPLANFRPRFQRARVAARQGWQDFSPGWSAATPGARRSTQAPHLGEMRVFVPFLNIIVC